jgi:hypothetical protein
MPQLMPSVVSAGAADRMVARTFFRVVRAGSGTPRRYSSTVVETAGLDFFIRLAPLGQIYLLNRSAASVLAWDLLHQIWACVHIGVTSSLSAQRTPLFVWLRYWCLASFFAPARAAVGVRVKDGAVFRGFGGPLVDPQVERVEVAQSDCGAVVRFNVRFATAPGSITVVYSDTDDGRRQKRLIATSRVSRKDPLSLGIIR